MGRAATSFARRVQGRAGECQRWLAPPSKTESENCNGRSTGRPRPTPNGAGRMPAVKNVGEPCAGEPHARIEVAAGGNRHQSAMPRGAGASRRPYISLESRRVEFVACTPNPTGAWVAQQARNLLMTLDDREQPLRFLIHDRDAKFSAGCDHIFQSEGIAVIRTPVQAPNA